MGVKIFGQYLIEQGEIDSAQLRAALELMDRENRSLGELATAEGILSAERADKVTPHSVIATVRSESSLSKWGSSAKPRSTVSFASKIELGCGLAKLSCAWVHWRTSASRSYWRAMKWTRHPTGLEKSRCPMVCTTMHLRRQCPIFFRNY